jgi:ubiquinone/menaquinone biosynthesis C-methylase UbiE
VVTKPLELSSSATRLAHDQASSRARFGAFAQRYVTSQTHAQGEDLERLVDIAQPKPHWLALDIATGGGHTALRFAPHVRRVIATDLTPRMLVAARTHVAERMSGPGDGMPNVAYGVADAQDLPFPSGSYNLVTCRIAPHHFADCARFVREGARVLVPGGLLLVQDQELPEDWAAARYIDAFERLRDPSHVRAYSESEWIALLSDAGLTIEGSEHLVKTHAFLPWAERQDCSAGTIQRLVERVERASPAVVEWMQPQGFGTPQATFVSHQIILAGRARGHP